MILKDFVPFLEPVVHPFLLNKIGFLCNYKTPYNMIKNFEISINCMALELIEDNIDKESLHKVGVIFTEDGSFSMISNDHKQCGSYCPIITISVKRLSSEQNEIQTYTLIEELTHHFYRIEDETKVKIKSIKIMQHAYPDFTIEKLKEWNVNWT